MTPMFHDAIDRNAILVRPRQPFYDWMHQVFPDDPVPASLDENNIYLIREMDHNEQIRRWIQKHFDRIFINELNGWCTLPSLWPQNRTYKMFCDLFTIEIHSMILDLESGPVTKD